MHDQPAVHEDIRFREAYNQLDEHERSMFACLEKDVERAMELSKPLLGIFKRRGQYYFVVLPEKCTYFDELKRAMRHKSELEIDRDGVITMELIQKLLGILRLKGHRLNGLELRDYIADRPYFEYHIDLEAA